MDQVYTNIKHAYRVTQLPHLGQSDRFSLLLTPAHTPLRSSTASLVNTITTWPEEALFQLQDFENQDLTTFTQAEMEYMAF